MSVNERRDIDNSQNNNNVSRNTCGRGFTTNRVLLLHLNACRRRLFIGKKKTCFFSQQEQRGKVLLTK